MAGLLQVRDALALRGSAQAQQLSHSLATPLPLVQAMLDRLTAMGKVERIEQDDGACLSGSCKSCPQGGVQHGVLPAEGLTIRGAMTGAPLPFKAYCLSL